MDNTEPHSTLAMVSSKVDLLKKENKLLKETVLDIETRSMWYNLIFSGIPRNTPDNPEALAKNFMVTSLIYFFTHLSAFLSSLPLLTTHSPLSPHTHIIYVVPLFVLSLYVVLSWSMTLLLCAHASLYIHKIFLVFFH